MLTVFILKVDNKVRGQRRQKKQGTNKGRKVSFHYLGLGLGTEVLWPPIKVFILISVSKLLCPSSNPDDCIQSVAYGFGVDGDDLDDKPSIDSDAPHASAKITSRKVNPNPNPYDFNYCPFC